MKLTKSVRAVSRRLWMIVIVPVIATAAAGIVSLMLPPVYEAQVALLIRPAQPLTSSDPTVVLLTSDQIASTYASLMTKRPILESIRSDLGLSATSDDLAREIKITPEPNTTILDVGVRDTNPARARDIANRLVADFIVEVKQMQQQETQVPNARSGDNLIVVSPAILPTRPVSPNVPLNLASGFAAGLVLALAIAILLDYFDQSIKTPEEVTELLGLISISQIAFAPAGKGRQAELLALDTHSAASEAYRALRTSLTFSTIDNELNSIVVTSSLPGEGKTRTAANLAAVLAQAGHKTLLIDADFRRPSLNKIFGTTENVGLSNLILYNVAETNAIVAIERVPNLWLMTSGPIPPNPSELLGSSRIRDLMARLTSTFTFVILDTPPVNTVTDAAILASASSGTVLVVEEGVTTVPALKHTKQLLDRVGAHWVGVVMNKVRSSSAPYEYLYSNSGTSSYSRPMRRGRQPESEPGVGRL